MLPKENEFIQVVKETGKQIVVSPKTTDFNSQGVLMEIEKIDREVKAVRDRAIVDQDKLSLSFTI